MTRLNIDHNSLDTNRLPLRKDIVTVCIYGLSILSASLFLFIPLSNLLSPSPWQRYMGTIHSFASLLAVIVVGYVGHLSFPLLRGNFKILPQMRILAFWSTIVSFLAIASGNWAYMRYTSPSNGAKQWIVENTPLIHYLFAHYHEFASLFILPLSASSTWILWKYGDSLLQKHNHSILVTTCIALMAMMFFAMGGMVSGLIISKVHSL